MHFPSHNKRDFHYWLCSWRYTLTHMWLGVLPWYRKRCSAGECSLDSAPLQISQSGPSCEAPVCRCCASASCSMSLLRLAVFGIPAAVHVRNPCCQSAFCVYVLCRKWLTCTVTLLFCPQFYFSCVSLKLFVLTISPLYHRTCSLACWWALLALSEAGLDEQTNLCCLYLKIQFFL